MLAVEGSYYLWVLREKTEESRYINAAVAYQEGVHLYSKENNELIAIRGWVTKIDDGLLTIENQEQQAAVKIDKEFGFVNVADENQEGLISPDFGRVEDLSQLVKIGDFVVISGLEPMEQGMMKGNVLSVLEFLRK